MKIFLFEARATVDARSSELPLANFDIVLAVAGAIKIRSAHLER